MRITFVFQHAGISGGVRVAASIAEELRLRGHEVTAVSTPLPGLSFRQKFRTFMRDRKWPRLVDQGRSYFDSTGVDHRVLETFRPITDADLPDADAIVATWWETGPWVHAASPRKGVKCIFLQQYEANFGFPEEKIDAVWRLPLYKIVCSKWLADLAKERFGQDVESVVHNGIDTALFHAPARGKQDVPTVGLMYGTNPVKGYDICLEALNKVRKAVPDCKVIAFANHEVVPRLPLPEGAEFHLCPSQSMIRDIYSRCDVWLCGSRSEGFHLPPHEAMACRTPVVSTRVGGPMDMIEDGVNGYLAEVNDHETLAARMLDVLTMDAQRWRRMSDEALKTALSFSWKTAAEKFEEALTRAIEQARPRRGVRSVDSDSMNSHTQGIQAHAG
ncbi:MAG: glycosyltransferase [Phycisphaera sp.]|nr:glycosyltransferase [Phycisphaera sp.]